MLFVMHFLSIDFEQNEHILFNVHLTMTLKNICYLDHNSSLKDPFDYVQKKTIKMRNRIDMNKKK